jgi:DNA-binding transcriptional regulator YdaS (Cro superfamily)
MAIDLHALLRERGIRPAHLAVRLDVNKATITRWAQKRIPAERVLDVERATGIGREVLRPDLYVLAPEAA